MTLADELVWYAAYGSNMCAERMVAYLAGGRPEGAARTYAGCRDARPPAASRALRFRHPVHFALRSAVWGGGIPFLDLDEDRGAAGARGRAYLLRRAQLDDLVAQENHRDPGGRGVDLDEVVARGRVVVGHGCYDVLAHVDTWDGVPVVTFTAPFSAAQVAAGGATTVYRGTSVPVEANGPSDAYVRMMAAGYRQAHGLDVAATATELAGCTGIARSAEALAAALGDDHHPDEAGVSPASGRWPGRAPSCPCSSDR